jgi:hypothetical protein
MPLEITVTHTLAPELLKLLTDVVDRLGEGSEEITPEAKEKKERKKRTPTPGATELGLNPGPASPSQSSDALGLGAKTQSNAADLGLGAVQNKPVQSSGAISLEELSKLATDFAMENPEVNRQKVIDLLGEFLVPKITALAPNQINDFHMRLLALR